MCYNKDNKYKSLRSSIKEISITNKAVRQPYKEGYFVDLLNREIEELQRELKIKQEKQK